MPDQTGQYGMVFDLNKCIGCHTCTMACKNLWTKREGVGHAYWNNVETQPGRGYPRNWQKGGGGYDREGRLREGMTPSLSDHGDLFTLDTAKVLMEGEEEVVKTDRDPCWSYDWDDEAGAGEWPNSYYFWLPRICNHCSNPPCLEACPLDAIYKRGEDGIVLVDQDRCRGYRYCMSACPYKKIFLNTKTRQAEKCTFCYPRVEKGIPPACAFSCVGRIRFVGRLEDPTSPVAQLVHQWKVALPLHPEHGTEPNVFYVPPLSSPRFDADMRLTLEPRIPLSFLGELFGGEEPVRLALETLENERELVRQGRASELMTLLLGMTADDRFPGFDRTGSGAPMAGASTSEHGEDGSKH